MQRFSIITRQDAYSNELKEKVLGHLEGKMIYDEQHPDLVISIGGDGTVLDTIHHYIDQLDTLRFVGLHTGTLGYYTDYEAKEWEVMCDAILKGHYDEDRRDVLQVKMNQMTYYALNEVRLEQNYRTMVCDVDINDDYLERFRGNGLCVSTPSGSTAYNRSLGGAIVSVRVPCLQMSEIAGIHHNAYRSLQSPLILGPDYTIRWRPHFEEGMILGIDRQIIPFSEPCEKIEISLSDKRVCFAHFKHVSLASRLRRSYISE